MYAKAALGLLPRSRPADLPTRSLATTVTVDRDHLGDYNRVCGFRIGDTLPATYPHVLAFGSQMRLMTSADFPFPVVGLIHIANRIIQIRPLHADESLHLEVHAENLRPHRRGRQFDVVSVATVDGAEVWRDVSTYLRKGPPSGSPPAVEDLPESPPPQAVWRVTPADAAAYAKVSGDRNPIHTSYLGARALGFPRRIAHGMWTKARMLAALSGRLPEAYTIEVAFKAPILLPSTVRFAARDGELQVFSRRLHVVGTLR